MRPTILWQHRRPLLRWGVFMLVLAAIGVVLYVMLPPEPRWECVGDPQTVFNVGNGRIATLCQVDGSNVGPVRLLDAATGSEIARFLSDAPTLRTHGRSDDGRYVVAVVPGQQPNTSRIRGVD